MISDPGTLIGGGETAGLLNTPASVASDETYELGLFYFERGDYEEAIQTLKEVANNSDSYVDAQKLLAEATDQYRGGIIDTANTYVEKDDYKLAVDILNAGLLVIPEDIELLQMIEEYSSEYAKSVRAKAIADAEAYAAELDYANAIKAIQAAMDEVGANAELDALQEKYLDEYKDFALVRADELFNSEGYEAAVQFLREVQSLPLLDSALSDTIAEYESYKPVSLETLEIWQHGDFTCGPYSHEKLTDNYGNTYKTSYHGSYSGFLNDLTFFNVYKVDGKYTTLSGIFCLKKQFNSTERESYLYIYGDDVLLESYMIKGGDEPLEFSVDISGISLLKIHPVSATDMGGEDMSFIANLFLTK